MNDNELANRRLEAIIESLDVPPSYYQLATDRYQSFAEWLHRPQSRLLVYDPLVYPQGSFRYGIVNRPLSERDEYDLDFITEAQRFQKSGKSQKELKQLLGDETKAYAQANGFRNVPKEKKRCWCLEYSDKVKFHMDITPGVPEEADLKKILQEWGTPQDLTQYAIGITDNTHPKYNTISRDWPQSNPKGYAKWFEDRMRIQAEPRLRFLVENRLYTSIDDIPAWEWKTPLQRSIQILKRHRDVMFKNAQEFAPISMIITTLSAHAYGGEANLYEALTNIVGRMPQYVLLTSPRVPNPTNLREDFADKWRTDKRYEDNFWRWHTQAKADVAALSRSFNARSLQETVADKLQVNWSDDVVAKLADSNNITRPNIMINSPSKPWAAG